MGDNITQSEVIQFLGRVAMLQKLPIISSSYLSLLKIADSVGFSHYDKGEYVVRQGDVARGLYFIWDGEAEVSGVRLSKYDYFGIANSQGTTDAVCTANAIALSQLTCLVLPFEHCSLLHTKSFADQFEKPSLAEQILHLEPIEVNLFQGLTLPDAPTFGKVFGGQFIGQAAAAASKNVDCFKVIHSLHAYFLLVGDINSPIMYEVYRLRDGKSVASRRVEAIQGGTVIFTLFASFQTEEHGFQHQLPKMPSVPDPETLLCLEQLQERHLIDPLLPRTYQNEVVPTKSIPWPIEIRFCEPSNATNQTETHPRCVVAFASDLIFLSTSLGPHRRLGLNTYCVSLDHSMWFHRSLRADDWILFDILTPSAHNARNFATGQMFSKNGELVVTLCQEGLFRQVKMSEPQSRSKL